MNKQKNIIFLTIIFFLFSCTGDAQKTDLNNKNLTQQQDINFDNVLKDGDYTWNEDYFMTADYGIIYNPKATNSFGNLIIYLVPKKKVKITDEQVAEQNLRVNGLTIDNLKKEFKIIIFLVDKKYLNYAKSGDPVYYLKPVYEEKKYIYDERLNKWIFIDSIKILESESEKEQTWRERFITAQIRPITTQNIIPSNYKLIQEKQGDLNLDGKTDKIIVYGTGWTEPINPSEALIYLVRVFLSNDKNRYVIIDNKNIVFPYYRDNVAVGFSDIKLKNNFFTVEQINAGGNSLVKEYTTFKYDNQRKDLFLYKYSTVSTERDSGDEKEKTSNYSSEDFGNIRFLDFNSSTILEKLNKK